MVRVDFVGIIQELLISIDTQLKGHKGVRAGKQGTPHPTNQRTEKWSVLSWNAVFTVIICRRVKEPGCYCKHNHAPHPLSAYRYLRLDVLLWCSDEAGAAEPQHDHDGQEEAGR